jgi:hypothetical protein
MRDEIKDQLDAVWYRAAMKKRKSKQQKAACFTDEHGNEYEDDSYVTQEMLDAQNPRYEGEDDL